MANNPITQAWLDGVQAAERGEPAETNPHSDSVSFSEWQRGWVTGFTLVHERYHAMYLAAQKGRHN